jgi:hypothetical protein
MNKLNYIVPLAVLLMLSASCKAQGDGDNQKVVFKINTEAGKMPISPYIYGVNDFKIPLDSIADVNVPNRRLGGNSFSTYNWKLITSHALFPNRIIGEFIM